MKNFIIIDNCLYKLSDKYLQKLNALSPDEMQNSHYRGNQVVRQDSNELTLLLLEIQENSVIYGDIYGSYTT